MGAVITATLYFLLSSGVSLLCSLYASFQAAETHLFTFGLGGLSSKLHRLGLYICATAPLLSLVAGLVGGEWRVVTLVEATDSAWDDHLENLDFVLI